MRADYSDNGRIPRRGRRTRHLGQLVFAALVILATVGDAGETTDSIAFGFEWLSDMPERWLATDQAWGALGIDVAAHAPGQSGAPLEIGNRSFRKGLGHHASGAIAVLLDGEYEWFDAVVGLQPCGGGGSVVFRVVVDGEKRFDSGVVRAGDSPRNVRVSLSGALELRLEAHDAGDGITCDMANWADARLTRSPTAVARESVQRVDVAPFARLILSNPDRQHGTRAERTEEFPAGDLWLDKDLKRRRDGTIEVPVAQNGLCCIGLEWLNRRAIGRLAVEFASRSSVPDAAAVEVEAWFGESLWQGKWEKLCGRIGSENSVLVFDPEPRSPRGDLLRTWKVRWKFPAATSRVVLRRLSAFTRSRWTTTAFTIERERAGTESGRADQARHGSSEVELSVVDGVLLEPASGRLHGCGPTAFSLRHNQRSSLRSDVTVLRVRDGNRIVSVAVEDILAEGCVYVPDSGLLLCRADRPARLEEHKKRIEPKQTLLAQVRAMPDQTLERALSRTHRPAQNQGPVMLSLSCDNTKYVCDRDGDVRVHLETTPPEADWYGTAGVMKVRFGENPVFQERHLDGGWLPVPVVVRTDGQVTLRQKTFVAPRDELEAGGRPGRFNRPSVLVAEFALSNDAPVEIRSRVALDFLARERASKQAQLRPESRGYSILAGDRVIGRVVPNSAAPIETATDGGTITATAVLPPNGTADLTVLLAPDGADFDSLPEPETLRNRVEEYWTAELATAARIETPDVLLNNLIRSSQVRCLIAARNEDGGARIAPWIAAMSYGPLESEAHSVIRGMDFLGHADFSQRGLDYFIHRYNTNGFLTTGYTTFGTGWHVWTLGEHWQLTRDTNWLRQVAPELARVGNWIVRQKEKTRIAGAGQNSWQVALTEGLMPPGVLADWNVYAFHFSLNGYYSAALRQLGNTLEAIGHSDARTFRREGDALARATARAFDETAWRAPVVSLRDGTWRAFAPAQVHAPGRVAEFFPGEDAGRSWAYDVELGSHQLVPTGVLEATDPRVGVMMEYLEDRAFLGSGWFDYPADENERDWFNLGGFAKVQPFYARNAEIYALRDDVRPFVRSYFNALASLANLEVLTLWEHFNHSGAWDKTHETGYFLYQTRTMLVTERGDELWLAPLTPSAWLENGCKLAVSNAPTSFGPVAYEIVSRVDENRIEALIQPPPRGKPSAIVMRLRLPDGKTIHGFTVNGRPGRSFDTARSVIRLSPVRESMRITVALR